MPPFYYCQSNVRMKLQKRIGIVHLILIFGIHLELGEPKKTVYFHNQKVDAIYIEDESSVFLPSCGFCQQGNLSNLQELSYRDNGVVNISRDAFKCLPSLTILNIERCGMLSLCCSLFAPLSTLVRLDLRGEYLNLIVTIFEARTKWIRRDLSEF